MRVRDHYFAAWAVERGVGYTINKGAVCLAVDAAGLRELRREYQQTQKPVFDRVKMIVKTINAARRD